MKKKYLTIFTILLTIPFSVFAATNPKVLTITAENNGSTINYNGTTEDGVHAVMCKLFNSSDEEIDMLSSSVDNKKFNGNFTNVSDGTYSIYCARYEGGEVKKTEIVVQTKEEQNNTEEEQTIENKTIDNTKENPKTYDAGINKNIIILVISAVGIVGTTIYLKKIKNN